MIAIMMTAMDKARAQREALAAQIEKLAAERDEIELRLRAAKAELTDLDTAIRIMGRFEESSPVPEPNRQLSLSTRIDSLTTREAVLRALQTLSGSKVGELVTYIENAFAMKVSNKTAGNALWMLKQEGVARRSGQKWYRVEQNTPH